MNPIDFLEEAAITRYPHPHIPSGLAQEERIATIAFHFQKILETLDLDLQDPSIANTPRRVAEMYVKELFSGLDPNHFPPIRYLENNFFQGSGNLILVKDIQVKSICEHHFVPIIGTARIGYFPKGKILGLSKINRIVDYFCRRPQIQERLNAQIADSLMQLLETEDVAVAIDAQHFCVTLRGVEDPCSQTHTHVLQGCFFTDPDLKRDFFR